MKFVIFATQAYHTDVNIIQESVHTVMELGTHLDQTLNTLSESLRAERRARFLLNLVEDDGYFVPSPELSVPQVMAEIV